MIDFLACVVASWVVIFAYMVFIAILFVVPFYLFSKVVEWVMSWLDGRF